MKKNYVVSTTKIKIKLVSLLVVALMFSANKLVAQCNNYQVYESIGTLLPTSGGTWTATSMSYGTTSGTARTGANYLIFNAAGDIIRTPQIANPGIFSFWHKRSGTTTGSPQFTIETSQDNLAWTPSGTVTPGASYAQYTLDLSALSLTNVYIRIVDTRGSGAAERYVDDISWTSTTTANNTVIPAIANCAQTVTCGTPYSFADAGGTNDTYNVSTDYTITFTPSIGTSKVQLSFSAFATESGYDGMVIYNGPTTASPVISSGLGVGASATNCPAGSYYGTTSPGTITSSDTSGAITIRFRSDASSNSAGWLASVSCVTSCVTPTAQATSLALAQPSNGVISGVFTAASPAPTNYLVVYNTTGTAPSPVNGTLYLIGSTVGTGNIVADNDTNTNFSVSGLNPSTQYYFFIFSFNSGCGGAPYFLTTSPLTGNATTPFFYCTATNPTNTSYYISGITTTGGATNFSNTGTGFSTGGYVDYSGTYSVSQVQGSGFSITATHPSSTYGYSVWVDWNGDGDFVDTGESVISTGYLSTPVSVGTVTVPLATPAGNYRMRIRNAYLSNPPTACGSHDYGEAEDYTITVIALAPCTSPTAQPTTLSLSLSGNSVNGSFMAASPAPTNYLVIYNTTGTIPSPANGTTYTVGSTVGAGNIVADNDTNTAFSVSALSSSTQYYFFIFSYNSACSGGPLYLAASPLNGNITTPLLYCTATNTASTAYYISGITTTGGATNFANTGTGFSTGGYFDYSGTYAVSQVQGSGFSITATHPSSTYGYSVWVDWNGDGDFVDTGESLISTGYLSSPASVGTITVPVATPAGNYRMRIRNAYLSNPPAACGSHDYGEAEDYTITVIALAPCNTPTAQPTVLNLTAASSTINGSFTAAAPAPSGYLIVRSSSATAPTLANGTSYAVGFTGLTPGTTYVVQGSGVINGSTAFSDSGLATNTTYYYHIFSYNSSCTGSPFYLGTSPLTNSATTCVATPTSPVNSTVTTSGFTISWGASAGALNYVLEVYTNAAYTTPAPGSPFTIASPTVSYAVTGMNGSTTYYYRIKATTASCSSGYVTGTVTTSLSNDECAGAIALTPVSTCTYTTYSNAGATATTGITTPGCASYSGGDVWFSVVVPATGEINVDLQAGTITDSGVAFYSGSCGSLTLLDCDDDSGTGLMSYLSRTGLTPGQTIYIRVWEYGNDNNGTFGICVTTPSCPSPSDLYANILSNTSVTVNWTASVPPASGGYQYYVSTSATPPTAATPPTGSTAAGVIGVTFTGLTPSLKYYFWVRSYCGGSDTSTWFGPTNYTPCDVGSGTGTTTLACPSVLTGGVGMNGNNPAAVNCSASTCTNLTASYLQLNAPTNYTVSSIAYAPPYQFTCLQNPVSVNVDDIWSPTINLPFNFCFYGNNYNKCLIGSNGLITFDTTSNTPGGYSAWSFNTNLPNASLFRNTIFGVYHDIDPSKGGEVGYELVTLTTGCRALVASWNDIPMYSSSCNSIYYTGMIVLYENTNVIEVYVKEKNLCATWNDGNAIVGLQNAAGTAAVVAPNRNGLDTNWTSTNEAWRFTPSGSSLTSVQWYQGSVATGTPISGATSTTVGEITTSTINVCPASTTTYTAEVTYALCNGNLTFNDNAVITVTGSKIWNGNTDTNWNIATNWTPNGVPTSADCVVIPDTINDPIISAAPDAVGYNLSVYSNAQLTVNSAQNLTITDKVTVQSAGIFTLNNSASLIQINNVLNSGNITYLRTSPSIRTLDYVYWSSPVSNFNVSNIVSPYTFGAVYKWNTTIANTNAGWGTWQNAAGETMIAGKGYIARAPGAAPFNNTTYNPLSGSFTGVPNNGNITIAIERGPYQGTPFNGTNGVQITNLSDNWNLLGNPYPSAIRGSQFLFDNNTKIEGNLRLWTHGTLPASIESSPFYGSYLSNYTPGDYLTYNFTGTSCCPAAGSDLFIGAGQGFFVQMIDGAPVAAAANVTVGFNNGLRSASYSNSTFYKTQNYATTSATNVNDIERNRIWLDFIKTNGPTDRILFGYIENATMGQDSFYDCATQNTGGTLIYSQVENNKYSIQGRSLPFDNHDEVSIGINAPTQGEYTIGIAAVDGLFNDQNIYLKDELLNVTHNLKATPYRFITLAGEINERFKVVYIDNTLGVPTLSHNNSIKVITNEEVAVTSSNLTMESIVVYNVLGQKLISYDGINSNYAVLKNLHKNNTTLLLKIKLQTGEIVTRKINY